MNQLGVSSRRAVAPLSVLQRVRAGFTLRGESIRDWSLAHGHDPQLVYLVMSGRSPCIRGKMHRIAVDLGLKSGHDFKARPYEGNLQDLNILNDQQAA